MATNKERAIEAAKEAAKQAARERILNTRDKGIADAQRNIYDPPPQQQGFNYDIMNYQSGWTSTGRALPEGIQQIRPPSFLSFRSGCKDLEDFESQFAKHQVDDEGESAERSRQQNQQDQQGNFRNFQQSVVEADFGQFAPKVPYYDSSTGTTVVSSQPPSPTEDALNALDDASRQNIQPNILELRDSPFLNLGRTATIIDRNDYAVPLANIDRDYGIENSLVLDHIKNFNGSFYVLDENSKLQFYKNIPQTKQYINKLNNLITKNATLNIASNESYTFQFTQNLRARNIDLQNILKRSFVLGQSFTGSIEGQNKETFKFQKLTDSNIELRDNTFSLEMPFENSELLNTLNLIGASIVDVKENYNFYIKEYEKIATNENLISKENVFPNLYVLNAILNENTHERDFLASLAKLDGIIMGGDNFFLNDSEKVIFGIKDSIGEYFDLFGLNYEKLFNNPTQPQRELQRRNQLTHDSYNNKLSNIIFLSDTTDKLNETNKKKYMFPMSIELSIPTDKTTTITKTLMDSDLMDSFMMKLYDLYSSSLFQSKESVITEMLFTQEINPANQQSEIIQKFSSQRKNINIINISDLLEQIKQSPINLNMSNCTIIGDVSRYMRADANSMNFVNGLRNIIFNSKLNTFVRNNYRTYGDILDDKKCYNETVAFRISKYETNSNSAIQNYWIPNNPDLDILNIVDTQVKYNKEYTYKIFAYQFVLGNRIIQESNTTGNQSQIDITVQNLPEANLVEIELLSTSKRVVDTPPLSPEILFVPYFGVDNKIGLFLNGRTGEEKLEPINILETDTETTSLYKRNLNNTVLYKSDDVAKRFEIMKLENKPNSYADFSKGFIKVVSTDVNPATMQNASAATFIDTIEPNKKYYYCFRTVDVHEKISNPSQIFEVEMINEKGMVFPIIKNYEFEKPVYSNTKEFRRFIKIKPASQHAFLNREKSLINDDTTAEQSLRKINLGLSDVAVPWEKTFKMVLTSKQTGKKCEFKFKFKYKTE